MTTRPALAPRSTLITTRYAGTCACGAKVQAGAEVAWSRAYEHPIVGCAACSFGTFGSMTPEALIEHARACMGLADNALKIAATVHPKGRARALAQVGRLLTLNTLAAEAARARRAA